MTLPLRHSFTLFPQIENSMSVYTVKQLSSLSGVSVRTLHHYDKIGLLVPQSRSEAGYRFYGREELLRLQQILFYRELDIPLAKIAELLGDPEFDRVASLEFHRAELQKRGERLKRLLATIDKTIVELKNKTEMLTDKEIYEGFAPGEGETLRKEAAEKWGEEVVAASEQRVRKMSKAEWDAMKKEGEAVAQQLAAAVPHGVSSVQAQKAIAAHFRHLHHFYEVSEQRYRGLGKLYVEDERFRAYYEKYAAGLADFVCEAISIFCDNGMKA